METRESINNDRFLNHLAIIDLTMAAAMIDRIITSEMVCSLKDICIESHDDVVEALKDIVIGIDEEIEERKSE